MKEGRLAEILDADVVKEEHNFEAIVEKVANLAKKCLALREVKLVIVIQLQPLLQDDQSQMVKPYDHGR
ncbi:hypothetical protein L3X38_021780 [Prunus dulcis]|uniref:Uncharacterized protein n=1 Tax=Prunus dulcis TaxID=3755 RepID=A0AAD4VWC1_PRUDU|nr:hypothetical protein L3X38_021780 [Prunus dulcis]